MYALFYTRRNSVCNGFRIGKSFLTQSTHFQILPLYSLIFLFSTFIPPILSVGLLSLISSRGILSVAMLFSISSLLAVSRPDYPVSPRFPTLIRSPVSLVEIEESGNTTFNSLNKILILTSVEERNCFVFCFL